MLESGALQIQNVVKPNGGEYDCRAVNEMGAATLSMLLKVLGIMHYCRQK